MTSHLTVFIMKLEVPMAWQVQDAKARFSELLDEVLKNGPQIVTRRGVEAVVLVPIDEWRRLRQLQPRRDWKDVLLGEAPRFELPKRRTGRIRLRDRHVTRD